MKYKDLNGDPIKWSPKNSPRNNASKNHLIALAIVKELMPTAMIFQECCVPLGLKKNLYIDILVPDFLLAIEVDGAQHNAYNAFFHKDRFTFLKQKQNDLIKEEWCSINNITLLRLQDTNVRNWKDEIVCAANRGSSS